MGTLIYKSIPQTNVTHGQKDGSPDLSPIEHIWDYLGWRVGHPTSLNELEAKLQQIWNGMSQDIIQNFYASIPDRIASCIHARGGSTGTATAGSDVVQSGRPIFEDFFQHLWPYIGNNTANVVFQMVKRLWLIRIDQ
ncbi:transposable element Tcb1 transposase [Trichonephila clavipes]|nr:transposable element Tcb1 transposase [Trichonephila clavipes]